MSYKDKDGAKSEIQAGVGSGDGHHHHHHGNGGYDGGQHGFSVPNMADLTTVMLVATSETVVGDIADRTVVREEMEGTGVKVALGGELYT